MSTLEAFPYFEFQVGKAGQVVDAAERARALAFFGSGAVSDLLVMSHGWNNDMAEARVLYQQLLKAMRALIDGGKSPLGPRTLGVLGILWPSKKFADEALIPGQAAAADNSEMVEALARQLHAMAGGFDHPAADSRLQQAEALLPRLAGDPAAQREFVDLVRGLLQGPPADDEGSPDAYLDTDGADLLQALQGPVMPPAVVGAGAGGALSLDSGSSGSAAGIGSFFSGIASAVSNLLNLTTYYQMKDRAGLLGRGSVHALVREIAASAQAPRVHLAGHSFGARLVSAVALGPEDQVAPLKLGSMTLLQAAFSHNGFAAGNDKYPRGYFRAVVDAPQRLSGPLLVSHTSHDLAVGLAYPLASRLAGQNAAGIGAADDPFGGLGRNGAQGTPEALAQDFGRVGASYAFQPAKVYNMNAEELIMDHGDIVHAEVAYALLAAVSAS